MGEKFPRIERKPGDRIKISLEWRVRRLEPRNYEKYRKQTQTIQVDGGSECGKNRFPSETKDRELWM